jgi:hypothetical protein
MRSVQDPRNTVARKRRADLPSLRECPRGERQSASSRRRRQPGALGSQPPTSGFAGGDGARPRGDCIVRPVNSSPAGVVKFVGSYHFALSMLNKSNVFNARPFDLWFRFERRGVRMPFEFSEPNGLARRCETLATAHTRACIRMRSYPRNAGSGGTNRKSTWAGCLQERS